MPGWIFRLYFDPPQSSYPLLFECFVLILVWIGQCSQIHVCLNPNFIFSILAFIEILLLYIPALWNLFLKLVRERARAQRANWYREQKSSRIKDWISRILEQNKSKTCSNFITWNHILHHELEILLLVKNKIVKSR